MVRDHLYSFWLDGRFWGEDEVTSPVVPDEAERTADVPIAELDLRVGQRIAYVFDFGDEWRVRLTLRERVEAQAIIRGCSRSAAHHRRSTS